MRVGRAVRWPHATDFNGRRSGRKIYILDQEIYFFAPNNLEIIEPNTEKFNKCM